jgi:hypothetical protein
MAFFSRHVRLLAAQPTSLQQIYKARLPSTMRSNGGATAYLSLPLSLSVFVCGCGLWWCFWRRWAAGGGGGGGRWWWVVVVLRRRVVVVVLQVTAAAAVVATVEVVGARVANR